MQFSFSSRMRRNRRCCQVRRLMFSRVYNYYTVFCPTDELHRSRIDHDFPVCILLRVPISQGAHRTVGVQAFTHRVYQCFHPSWRMPCHPGVLRSTHDAQRRKPMSYSHSVKCMFDERHDQGVSVRWIFGSDKGSFPSTEHRIDLSL